MRVISYPSGKSNSSYDPKTLTSETNCQFFSLPELENWEITLKTIGHILYATSSIVHHFKAISEFKLALQPGNALFRVYIVSHDFEIWPMTLTNNRTILLGCFKLYASFESHRWIQTEITICKRPIWVKIVEFLSCVNLQFDRRS